MSYHFVITKHHHMVLEILVSIPVANKVVIIIRKTGTSAREKRRKKNGIRDLFDVYWNKNVTPTPRLTSPRARAAGFAKHTLHAIDVRAQRTSASDHEREVRKKGGREL